MPFVRIGPLEPSFAPPTPFRPHRYRDVTRPRERTKSLEEVEAFVRHARLVDGFVSDRGKQLRGAVLIWVTGRGKRLQVLQMI